MNAREAVDAERRLWDAWGDACAASPASPDDYAAENLVMRFKRDNAELLASLEAGLYRAALACGDLTHALKGNPQ